MLKGELLLGIPGSKQLLFTPSQLGEHSPAHCHWIGNPFQVVFEARPLVLGQLQGLPQAGGSIRPSCECTLHSAQGA